MTSPPVVKNGSASHVWKPGAMPPVFLEPGGGLCVVLARRDKLMSQ
jgi:hypothetical protein